LKGLCLLAIMEGIWEYIVIFRDAVEKTNFTSNFFSNRR